MLFRCYSESHLFKSAGMWLVPRAVPWTSDSRNQVSKQIRSPFTKIVVVFQREYCLIVEMKEKSAFCMFKILVFNSSWIIPWQEPQNIFLNEEFQKWSFPSYCPLVGGKKRGGGVSYISSIYCMAEERIFGLEYKFSSTQVCKWSFHGKPTCFFNGG